MVLVLCILFDDALYLYEISWKYLKRFFSYCRNATSTVKFLEEHNSVKNVGGVTAFLLWNLSDDVIYVNQEFQNYWADMVP